MKVLVSGAAGFIGSNLAEKLARRGDQVVGLDNFNDYYDPAKKRANEQRLATYANFKMIEADIRDREQMLELFEEERFEAVAHLAALAGVRPAVKYPDLYVEVDYNGSQNLMDAARFNQIQNFVFASTSSVYGATKQIPFLETDACDRPLQPYAAAKRGVEMLGYTYHYLYDLNFTAIRFFTVYGPNGRPDMMAYLVADSATKGTQIPIYNGGQMYRDWTFVEDITDGVMAALDRPLGYEIINLGRGEPTLLKDFVRLIEDLAGNRANLIDRPKPAADVEATYADISKAATLLGYDPKISVEQGVAAFWDWYRVYG
ncbi:MAG TPA: SDR family NAD(P)-dependent oxidoreductase [Anaerolineae bacterium]|jgi:UDP-glucuronate 4-epimerase|nr:SDR family NAD(P)-dependent oxidoreductase [Anaerolineae bacterium]